MKRAFCILFLLLFLFTSMPSGQAQQQVAAVGNPLRRALRDESCRQWVDSVMEGLSLKERVAQLFIYTIAPHNDRPNLNLLQEVVETHKVGGLLFSGGNMQTQVELTNRAQQQARVPLLLTFDGEWGLAMRLKETPSFPRNRVLGCIRDNELIRAYGREVARQCREIGVQVNFAPVADVDINPKNPVINTRSFGEQPEQVADKVIAYATGLEEGGVLSVCKHFPGHGDTDVDSHKALPLLPFTRERLDSIELYPFKKTIRAGLNGMMVGHLQVPALDPKLPASLSRNAIQGLLVEELGFNGLVFTDALAMKGVAGQGQVCLKALKAGNDIVLAPRNIREEIRSVVRAVENGDMSREEIDAKCRKVLAYKYVLGLKKKPQIQISGLEQRIHNGRAEKLIDRLKMAAVTVLSNKDGLLPLYPDSEQRVALLEVGAAEETAALAEQMARHGSVTRFTLRADQTNEQLQRLRRLLAGYKRIVVAVGNRRPASYRSFFAGFSPKVPVTYVFFTPGKAMTEIRQAVSRASAVVLAHSADRVVQTRVADVLFGKATADGRLSASIGTLFPAGVGEVVGPKSPVHFVPEEYGFSSAALLRIDSIALDGIAQGAFPGCQVVVLKEGHMMVDKTFGTQAGAGTPPVRPTDMYDLASLSKTTGTLLALMKLYDKGRFNLTDRLSDYLSFLKQTDKRDITVQEVLFHQAGLPASISFYMEAIAPESYSGKLFTGRRDARHTVQLGATTWVNPNFKFNPEYISSTPAEDYTIRLSNHLWLNRSFRKVIETKIAEAPLRTKRYVYSDVGFILLGMLVEQLAGMPMDDYLQQEYYRPMGLERTGYLPLRRFAPSEIAPTARDRFLRKELLQGFVHDEACAFSGGMAGNAGLFSTAREVARIYQMLLNGGEIDGHRYLSKETCELFTTRKSAISRRGLGFDKPDPTDPDKGNCTPAAPLSVYGHVGFTGTCAWVDPENKVVYVFLCNRICPDVYNPKLGQLNIREEIQAAIYRAMGKNK